MRRTAYIIMFLLIATFVFLTVPQAAAGGCCFKYYTPTSGVAGKVDARLSVAFVDPNNPYADEGKTTFSSYADKRMEVYIANARAGQFCRTNSDRTDRDGHMDVHCSSPYDGDISVYFTSPDADAGTNGMISSYHPKVHFAANPDAPAASPTQTPVPVNSPATNVPTAEPTSDQVSSDAGAAAEELANLKAQVGALQNQVQVQQEKVNWLTELVTTITDFLGSLFHFSK